jgi:hypothetical protein
MNSIFSPLAFLPPDSIPPEFAPLVRRLSNVKVMVLATGQFQGRDRNILFIGELHSKSYHRKQGFVPISEIIVSYLNRANFVDFMFETAVSHINDINSSHSIQAITRFQEAIKSPKNTTNADVINQIRRVLSPYIPTQGHPPRKTFPKARAHYLDFSFDPGHKKFNTLLNLFTCLAYTNKSTDTRQTTMDKIKTELIELSRFMDDDDSGYPLTDDNFRFAFGKEPFAARKHTLRLIFNCAFDELRRVVLNRCYRQGRNIKTSEYTKIFLELIETLRCTEIEFYFQIHRFLMDIYTCCRILKTDANERWYKNMVVYTGGMHTARALKILQLYGFTLKNIDFKNLTPNYKEPAVPPFRSGFIHDGRFYRDGEATPSAAEPGYEDSTGRFFQGPAPGYYEID